MIYPQTTKIYFSLYPPRIPFTSFTAGRVNSFALSPLELRGPNRNRFGNRFRFGKRFQTGYGPDLADLAAVQYGDFNDTDHFGGDLMAGSGAGQITRGKVGYLAGIGNSTRMAGSSMR